MAAIYMAVTFYKFHLGQHARINNQYLKKKKENRRSFNTSTIPISNSIKTKIV